jgi:hypothetical protein
MKPPPLIIGAALLFWGWRSGMLWLGIIGAFLIEFSHIMRGRWSFTDTEFNRIWDVCTVLFVGAAIYLRFSDDLTVGAYRFFDWMPAIFYPMALGYAYSARDAVPMKTFSWLLRRKGAQGGEGGVAFGWIYLVVCLVAAGANSRTDIGFFAGSSFLVGWALWINRAHRLPALAWCTLFLLITGAAFYGQSRMVEVQTFFENKISELIVKFAGRKDFDPGQTQTSMGRIGSLKQSSRVVMKVKSESGRVPEKILECTYGKLDGNIWKSGDFQRNHYHFEAVQIEPDATTWNLSTNVPIKGALRVIQRVNRRRALLAVPFGTYQLKELAAGVVETNYFGVIRVKDSPGLLNFVARFGPVETDTWEAGRRLPIEDEEAIEKIADEMNIDNLPDDEKIKAIPKFFENRFRYTTYQQAQELGLHNRTPLSNFLLKTHAGHCEYFATATVLLLWHYGIPARYATGYAVSELSHEEDAYIIRERDGHAWAVAHVNGEWVEVDSTPPGWAEAEAAEFPRYQDLKDAWARFVFGFMEWRWLGDWGFFRLAAPWLVLPLTGFLVWRIFGRRMTRAERPLRETQLWPGADSEFFALERKLAKRGLARENGETTEAWLRRVQEDAGPLAEVLFTVVRLHQKYRFGCDEIEPGERDRLRQSVQLCLTQV